MRYTMTIEDHETGSIKTMDMMCAAALGVSDEPSIGGIETHYTLMLPGNIGKEDLVAFYLCAARTVRDSFTIGTDNQHDAVVRMTEFLISCAAVFSRTLPSKRVVDAFRSAAGAAATFGGKL